MIFEALTLKGCYLLKPEKHADQRGFFARSFCRQAFQEHHLVSDYVQSNISYNKAQHTLRGMHYQSPPFAETKLIRCIQGEIFDVFVDIRPESEQYLHWQGIKLSSDDDYCLYLPAGFAHGFLSLTEETRIFYQMSEYYRAEKTAGFNWQDPQVGIDWPTQSPILSERDEKLPMIADIQE